MAAQHPWRSLFLMFVHYHETGGHSGVWSGVCHFNGCIKRGAVSAAVCKHAAVALVTVRSRSDSRSVDSFVEQDGYVKGGSGRSGPRAQDGMAIFFHFITRGILIERNSRVPIGSVVI